MVNKLKKVQPLFQIGDQVRLSKNKKTFKKSYLPNWTEEIFTVSKRLDTNPPTYKIIDIEGFEIKGSFYEPEMQFVEGDIYHIEKIIKTRTFKTGKQYLVKWVGYDNKHNSWVKEDQMISLAQ